MTFSKSVSKRPNLCRNDSYIFGRKHVSVSKWHCVEIVCVEVTDTHFLYSEIIRTNNCLFFEFCYLKNRHSESLGTLYI